MLQKEANREGFTKWEGEEEKERKREEKRRGKKGEGVGVRKGFTDFKPSLDVRFFFLPVTCSRSRPAYTMGRY